MPSLVIVGRPNVGKSTLFNAITGQRRAIVGDEPGITRDRIYGQAEHRGKHFQVIDTGGLIPHDHQLIPAEIFRQAAKALEEADHIVFLIDGRTEITAIDRELAEMLHRLNKPVTLAINKIDSAGRENLTLDFHQLGFEHVFPISAEHKLGIDDLLDHVTATFPPTSPDSRPTQQIKVAIIGRPNVGKSTLLNALTGADRAIVSPIPGTTRDAVDERIQVDGVEYVFVDTAGIRRKGKTRLTAEKLSVVMAKRHVRLANVVLVVLDATEGVTHQDAAVAGYAHQQGRPLILVVNKWDAAPDKNKKAFLELVRSELRFLEYAPVAFVSALQGRGLSQLFPLIRKGYEAASRRITTGELNRFAATLHIEPPMKIYYMTQTGVRPPVFVLFVDRPEALHFSSERYLINRLREHFGFEGTPIVIKARARKRRS